MADWLSKLRGAAIEIEMNPPLRPAVRICEAPGCEAPIRFRGMSKHLCNPCYRRKWRADNRENEAAVLLRHLSKPETQVARAASWQKWWDGVAQVYKDDLAERRRDRYATDSAHRAKCMENSRQTRKRRRSKDPEGYKAARATEARQYRARKRGNA